MHTSRAARLRDRHHLQLLVRNVVRRDEAHLARAVAEPFSIRLVVVQK